MLALFHSTCLQILITFDESQLMSHASIRTYSSSDAFVMSLIPLLVFLLLASGSVAGPSSIRLLKPVPPPATPPPEGSDGYVPYGRVGEPNSLRSITPFAQEGLRRHNELRVLHGSPEMTIDNSLCSAAQSWANELAATDSFRHSGRFGENLFMSWGGNCNNRQAVRAVDSWYNEIKDYNFNQPGFGFNTGHFTQVVWKSSTNLCMAKAESNSRRCYIVANYDPPGNFQGRFESNVPRPNS